MPDIETALQRLRAILPLEAGQNQLPESLRLTHLLILRFFLEEGCAPTSGDITGDLEWSATLQQLETAGLIVLDAGCIAIAYPFSAGDRGYRVTSAYGRVEAVCAFDALAIGSMFSLPTRIDSHCQLSGEAITIQQNGQDFETELNVIAAIDWSAADSGKSCAASLCTEMLFIGNQSLADAWRAESSSQRELFTLQQAQRFICAFFLPLVAPEQPCYVASSQKTATTVNRCKTDTQHQTFSD